MATQTQALEKLSGTVDMTVFQELLDLDTPNDPFSKDVVREFLIHAPETLTAMNESLLHQNLSTLGFNSQSLRCTSLVLGLTNLEKSCARIETILSLGVDLHYTGIGLHQICDILGFVVRDAHSHFEAARSALTMFYGLRAEPKQ